MFGSKRNVELSQILPFMASVISLLGCLLFLHLYLVRTAQQFSEDFEKQNLSAFASGDSYELASHLNSLSSSVHWLCVSASTHSKVFYAKSKVKQCGEGFFQTVVQLRVKGDDQMNVRFTLTLPPLLKWSGVIFAGLQLLLLWSLFLMTRKSVEMTEQARFEGKVRLTTLATQVAHDIRSPLSALSTIAKASALPEAARTLLDNAIERIQVISEDLLRKNREISQKVGNAERSTNTQPQQRLSALIESLIQEKRLQFAFPNPSLDVKFSPSPEDLVVRIHRGDFLRALSNLLNNAIEAVAVFRLPPERGTVSIATSSRIENGGLRAIIQIRDNGPGIPKNRLSKLKKSGGTFGKKEGNGLGLTYARKTFESAGGSLQIESEVGIGTTVTIKLPQG